jgi:hypothetical protein
MAPTSPSRFKLLLVIAIVLAGAATSLVISLFFSDEQSELTFLEEDASGTIPSDSTAAGKAAGAKAPPPKFRTFFDETEDPNSAHYDPVEVARSRKIKVEKLFEREPRDEPWASERQETLGNLLSQDISAYPGAALVNTECRRYSCKYVVDVPKDKFQEYRRGSIGLGNVVKNVEAIESPDREGYIRLSRISIVKRQFKDQEQFMKDFVPSVRRSQAAMRERRKAEAAPAAVDPLLLPKTVTP